MRHETKMINISLALERANPLLMIQIDRQISFLAITHLVL